MRAERRARLMLEQMGIARHLGRVAKELAACDVWSYKRPTLEAAKDQLLRRLHEVGRELEGLDRGR